MNGKIDYKKNIRKDKRGVAPSELGRVNVHREDTKGWVGEEPRYDVGRSNRIAGYAPIKEISFLRRKLKK